MCYTFQKLKLVLKEIIFICRMYALRRIRDSFKENSSLSDSETIAKYYYEGMQSLETIKRQVSICKLN